MEVAYGIFDHVHRKSMGSTEDREDEVKPWIELGFFSLLSVFING